MGRKTNGWMDKEKDRHQTDKMDEYTDEQIDEERDRQKGQRDRHIDRQMHRWKDRWIEKEGWTNGQKAKSRVRQVDWIDRQNRQTYDIQIERYIER